MAKIELVESVSSSINCEADQVELTQAVLNKYPVLKRAVLLHGFARDGYLGQREIRGTISAYDIQRVGALIDRVNPQYPGDSFSPTTVLALLTGSFLDVEEVDIIEKALPDYSGSRRVRVSAVPGGNLTVTFEHSMKHSGLYYEVGFSGSQGLSYPVTVSLRTYLDSDDLRNHYESDGDCGCPERWQHWTCEGCGKECEGVDPAYCGGDEVVECYHCGKEVVWGEVESWAGADCNCEMEVAFEGELIIQDDFNAERVGEWLEEHLFEGQQE